MSTNLKFVIITGLSGAGKSEAMRCFEDMGYFCVDNLPPALVPKFAELCVQSADRVSRVVVVSDIRGGEFFNSLFEALNELENKEIPYQILYLEASQEALVRRYKETRRRHPLAPQGRIVDSLASERVLLEGVRGRAHHIIDTTSMNTRQLHAEINRVFGERDSELLSVAIVSFGFKNGIPLDADMVFDVRFLPNPHYVASLKPLTGNDPAVEEYVFCWPTTQRFIEKVTELLSYLLPQFVTEGKTHLIIGVGCTGGQHRSVAVANHLGQFVSSLGYRTRIDHRDINDDKSQVDKAI
jgi:UPF0042 nucleotide-binding protein